MSTTENAAPQTLQDAIDAAGTPIEFLWRPEAAKNPWRPPVVPAEFEGWRAEQHAWGETVALMEQSHHMRDLFISGPDATRLLSETSANNYRNFQLDQAKQFIPVTERGHIITDAILLREAEDKYVLTGPDGAGSWVLFHAQQGGYDVDIVDDPPSHRRGGADPILFRYQVQGPRAIQVIERVFGQPLPSTRFFHSVVADWDGRPIRAIRHGMAGEPGYEFVGRFTDGQAFKDALLQAGADLGIQQVGALAYATVSVGSGWVAAPTPGIYSDAELADYRRWLTAGSWEAVARPLHGSNYSADVEDFYVTPYDLGYGSIVDLEHGFVGRDALKAAKNKPIQTKVSLEFDKSDLDRLFGGVPGYFLSYGQYRLEVDGEPAGATVVSTFYDPVGTIISIAFVDPKLAAPGTVVEVVYGEDPGPHSSGTAPRFERVRAVVRPSPYNQYTRENYRR